MAEYEKAPPYYSPPAYNPQQYPQPGVHTMQPTSMAAPQASGYPAQATQPQQIVVPTTTVIRTAGFGDSPTQTVCPNCQTAIVTRTRTETSNCQHLVCCLMFVTGACTLFSCLPYCCDNCANVRHECPRCGTHLGSYTR